MLQKLPVIVRLAVYSWVQRYSSSLSQPSDLVHRTANARALRTVGELPDIKTVSDTAAVPDFRKDAIKGSPTENSKSLMSY